VVLVLVDTLRPDHLELFGYPVDTAPFIAQLGARGLVFDRALSTSGWTPPATASVVTGLYPERHGVVSGIAADDHVAELVKRGESTAIPIVRLPTEYPTLAERFHAAGYATYGVVANVHINPVAGHARGFDRFELHRDADARQLAEVLAGFLAGAEDHRPRFVYLHLMDVHPPYRERSSRYAPRPGALGKREAAYDGAISFADEALRDMYERFGWAERTVLCVVSDHGEGFGEGGLVGHGPSLSWVVNRCVMMFAGTGVAPGRVQATVSLVDVAPTLLELAGQPPPEGLDGRSLLPLADPSRRAAAEAEAVARPTFAHRRHRPPILHRVLWSVALGRWKLIHDEVDGRSRLYDMDADPHEEHDVSATSPTVVSQLTELRRVQASRGVAGGGGEVELQPDAELLEHLRALGYAGDDDR
jgi:arylsulfatase A-like enzyme